MSDNSASSGGTGDIIATDDLSTINGGTTSGVKVQRTKVGYGLDGDFTDVSTSNPLPVRLSGTVSQTLNDASTGAYPSSVTLKGEAGGPLEGVALLDELVQGNFQIPVINTDLLKGPNGGLISADGQTVYATSNSASSTAGVIVFNTNGYPSLTLSGVAGGATAAIYFSDAPGGPWLQSAFMLQQSATSWAPTSQVIFTSAAPQLGWAPVVGTWCQIRFTAISTGPATAAVTLRLSQCLPPTAIFAVNPGFNLTQINGSVPAAEAATINAPPLIAGARTRTALITALTAGQAAGLTSTNSAALVVEKHSVPELTWSYAPPVGGLTNTTTAVTIKAAVAGQRGNISTIQLSHSPLGAATEFAIRDGAAGTVMWRHTIPLTTAEGLVQVTFDPPLRQAAVNTLLEIVTLTASVTGAVYFNAQGFMSN